MLVLWEGGFFVSVSEKALNMERVREGAELLKKIAERERNNRKNRKKEAS